MNADGYVSTGQGILSANMFAYCENNPVMKKDPSGKCAILLFTVYFVAFFVQLVKRNAEAAARPKVTLPMKSEDYRDDSQYASYGVRREGGRTHKGIDFYPSDSKNDKKFGADGTPKNVYAMADGTVIEYKKNFYAGTAAVVIDHGDFIALYGEISSDLRKGDTVTQGQYVGIMKRSQENTLMLHLEIFVGGYGNYTKAAKYRVNPTYAYSLPEFWGVVR